jgi:hypothetical protein
MYRPERLLRGVAATLDVNHCMRCARISGALGIAVFYIVRE